MTNDKFRYLDTADVEALTDDLPVLDLVRAALVGTARGDSGLAPEAALRWTTPAGHPARSLILPAWAEGAYGAKIINSSLGNRDLGLPRAAGIIVLFDPETAAPVCVMEGGRISALRTAAVSLVALDAVRGLGSVTDVAFLGAGRQAEVHLELLRRFAPNLGRVLVHDQDPARAEEFAVRYGCEVAPARDAVGRAGLSIAVTTTTEPYVELDWVPAGATFVNVSLDDAAESLLLGCDHLFVDSWELVLDDEHRLLGKLHRTGKIGAPGGPAPAVSAELKNVLTGRYHRSVGKDDRVVVNPFGMGVNDIAIASAVLAAARVNDIGQLLPR